MSDWTLSPTHAALVKNIVEQFNRQHPTAFREQIAAYVKGCTVPENKTWDI